MKAKEYVQSKYPDSWAYSMIDNDYGRNSYVIVKGGEYGLSIFTNEHANTASKAWTNAKIEMLSTNGIKPIAYFMAANMSEEEIQNTIGVDLSKIDEP